tara:strand:- start:40 stop:393 length:354 start_codon:yes stop_codon:yes gene_type:complete
MFENLKKKWGIENSFQLTIVFIVFAITGSVAAKISDPISAYFNLDDLPGLIYWPIRLLIVFPAYQILLVFFGFIFGILVSIFTFKKDKFIFNFFLKMSILFTKKLIKFLSFGIFYKN